MNPTEQFDPPIEIAASEKVIQTVFNTPNELMNWVNAQREFYQNLFGKSASNDPALSQVWTTINSLFNTFTQQINNTNSNPKAGRDAYINILSQMLGSFNAGRLFDSTSPTANFLLSLKARDQNLAARVYAILSGIPFNLESPQGGIWLQAGAICLGWQRGWLDEAPAVDASLTALRGTWDKRFSDMQEQFKAVDASHNERLGAISELKESWSAALTDLSAKSIELQKSITQDTAQAIVDGEKKIADFSSAYNQALALRAPTQYWREKQIGHQRAAAWWFAAFTVSAGAAIAGVWFVWHATVDGHFPNEPPPYTAFIPSIGAALLITWFMRMFSRQLISNLSLSADASERVAMVKTYLALTEGGHAKDSDRGLILSSLFRSAAKTTDDAAPPTAADLVTKILKGDK
jgi:hypothetical protein